MSNDAPYHLFARYLTGEADQRDIAALQSWLEASEQNKIFFHSITEFWDSEAGYFSKESGKIAQNLAQRIKDLDEGPHRRLKPDKPNRKMPKGKPNVFPLSRIAAAIAILILAGASLFFSGYFDGLVNKETPAVANIERFTNRGEKLNIKLPDGSLVKLNANSQLIFPEEFSAEERKATLVGEAFFEVTKDASKPFIIISGDISTTVLGTTFNIRAFPEENNIKVAVVSGKVAVENIKQKGDDPNSLLLAPNEMAVYTKVNNQTVRSEFDYNEMVAWKDGIIYFKDAGIYEILETLELWYGVTFVVNAEMDQNKGFTVSYKDKSLEAILQGLGFAFAFEYEINGKIITIN